MPRSRMFLAAVVMMALVFGGASIYRSKTSLHETEESDEEEALTKLETRYGPSAEALVDAQRERDRIAADPSLAARVEKVEEFLRKKGRSAPNLFAAMQLLDEEQGQLKPHLDELSDIKSDPVAMALAVSQSFNMRESAERWSELEPENCLALLSQARELTYDKDFKRVSDITPALDAFFRAVELPEYSWHGEEIEAALFDAASFVFDDVRETWSYSHDEASSYRANTSGAGTTGFIEDYLGAQDVDLELRKKLAVAAERLAQRASDAGAVGDAFQWDRTLSESLHDEDIPQLLGMDKATYEARRDARYDQGRRDLVITEALKIVSDENLALMERVRQEKGIDAAKQALLDQIGAAEQQRLLDAYDEKIYQEDLRKSQGLDRPPP